MALVITHVWRMLRWGRILGRHGALRPFENHPEVPAALKLIARLARLGSFAPKEPRYSMAFQAIGPAAIKLGQALATRPDLVGAHAARDLSKLQDKLPAFPFSRVRATIEQELGAPLETFFAHFDPDPVGAASIAQVHKAVTQDGRLVAVKVLRPGIETDFARAMETYRWIAGQIELLGGEPARLRPRSVIETFYQWTIRELDLRLEAANASELAMRMEHEANYFVPAIDWDRTTRRVLTLEWIEGIKLTDKSALAAGSYDRKKLAATAVQVFLKQAIAEGVFHADLHQGNAFVDTKGRLAVVDFGIVGRLDPLARRYLAEILYGLLTRNYHRVAQIHIEARYIPAHYTLEEFATALRAVGEPILGKPIKEISVGRLLEQLFAITRVFEMPTQPHLLLLQKTMVMVEGFAATLDPDANMWELAEPFVANWIREELGVEAKAARFLRQGFKNLQRLPTLLERLEDAFPAKGAAPPGPPLPELPKPIVPRLSRLFGWALVLCALFGAGFALGALV